MDYQKIWQRQSLMKPAAKPNDPFPESYYKNQKLVKDKIAKMTELKKQNPYH